MQRAHSNHEQYWEMIPWIVNGRASEAEQRAVLAHIEDCSECREELERHRALYKQMRGTDEVIAAPNAAWQKLLAQIDEQADAPLQNKPLEPYRISRPWLVAALWIQLVAIAALAGALFSSTVSWQPEYSTLSTPQVSDRRAAVRVVFAPDARLNEINRLLRQVECDIVAGPSDAGVYTLATAEGQDVQRIIATLREHADVLFAEPQIAAGSRQ